MAECGGSATGGNPRLRVLVGAYAVSPQGGSEPGLGWNLCSRLARHHDVTVLCSPGIPGQDESLFRDEAAAATAAAGPVPGLTLHYVEAPPLSRLLQRETTLARRTLYYAGYAAWQRAAARAARALHARRPFDLAHHLNITGYREPGYLWTLGVPFVWGPVGGASDVPRAFLPLMGPQDRAYYAVRNVLNAVQKRVPGRCHRAARAAAHVWAIGDDNLRMFRDRWGVPAERTIESGAEPRDGAEPKRLTPGRPLRVVWSGQHIGRKALPILLRAMAATTAGSRGGPPCELTVLGDGPETNHWRALAARLGLSGRVRWTGRLPYEAALAEVGRADVLAFTSVQEGTPHTVLEALSLGLPVVCHDACGMGVAVDGRCGIKVPMRTPAESVASFADAIATLGGDAEHFTRLSAGALMRSNELSWDAKAAEIAAAYSRVAAAQAGGAPVAPGPGDRVESEPEGAAAVARAATDREAVAHAR